MRFWIFIAFLVVGCSQKEEVVATSETIETPVETSSEANQQAVKPIYEAELDKSLHSIADHVLIYDIEWKVDKEIEGSAMLNYRIDFVKNGKVVKDFAGRFQTDKGAEWSLDPEPMKKLNEKQFDPRFIQIDIGVAACGYIQNHLLFFLDENQIEKVLENQSMTDSGFGTYTDFIPTFESGKAIKFSTVRVNIGEAESSTEEKTMLEIGYSDSANYVFENGKWNANRITPKEKEYRKEIKSFDAFYLVPEP